MSNQNTNSNSAKKENSIIINDRRIISLTGIDEVVSFDENTVVLSEGDDNITVDGCDMNITKLSLETGDVIIQGKIDGVFYSRTRQKKQGLFTRFRQ